MTDFHDDDPRARELKKAAVKLAEACVEHEDAWTLRRSYRGAGPAAQNRFSKSLRAYNKALTSYRKLREALEKEEEKAASLGSLGPPWRNDGE